MYHEIHPYTKEIHVYTYIWIFFIKIYLQSHQHPRYILVDIVVSLKNCSLCYWTLQ